MRLREFQRIVNDVRTRRVHGRKSGRLRSGTGTGRYAFHIGIHFEYHRIYLARYLLRVLEPRILFEFDLHADGAVIGHGHEVARHFGRHEQSHQEDDEHGTHHDRPVAYGPRNDGCIPVVEVVKETVNRLEYHTESLIRMHVVALEQLRRKHRRQRNSRQGGYRHDDGDHPTELPEHDTRHARHERKRQEHGNDRQCRHDDRQPHLVGTVYGRLLGRRALFHVGGDILQYHDGIVHDHTDGDGERTERDDVDGTARQIEVDETGE